MKNTIKQRALNLALESLDYTRDKFENYPHYPSYEFKLERLKEVEEAVIWPCVIAVTELVA